MLFSNQKFFLDVKDYSKIDRLEAGIRQFGGIIEKFLSKEITCVVTNKTRTENMLLNKDISTSTPTHFQSLRSSACGSRVMSRGQSLLMRSNSLKDTSVCDPVAFAQMWGIKIVTLDTVEQAIDRQLSTCDPSSPITKPAVSSQHVVKKRKFSGTTVKVEDTESNIRPFVTKFSSAFIKFEDTKSNFRPFFKQYSTFLHVDVEGDLSNGIFKCDENIRPVALRKSISTTANTRQQKVWSKRGYCECCDVMYEDLNQHLVSADHQRFVEHTENFVSLDKLIDQVSLTDSSAMLLPAEDICTLRVAACDEVAFTECAKEVHLRNCHNLSTLAVNSASCHDVNLQQNQSHDCQSKSEQSDKVVCAVENCEENHSVSGDQTGKCSRSPVHISVNDTGTHSVNLENYCADHAVEKVSDSLHSQTLCSIDCADSNMSASGTVSQSVDSYKTNEALYKKKLCTIAVDRNSSHDDDMPQFISSDCVVNLLELLSSENHVVDSTVSAEETRSYLVGVSDNHSSIPLVNSLTPPSADAEVLREKEHCQQTMTTSECYFPLTSMQNDLLDRFGPAVAVEQNSDNIDKSTTNSESVSNSVMLPAVDLSNCSTFSSTYTAALSATSLITNDVMNHNDTGSCNTTMHGDASDLLLCEVENDSSSLPPVSLSVDEPAIGATSESSVPVYAHSPVNNVCTFGDNAFSPVHYSDLLTDSFNLHDKLLTVANGLNTAEHSTQQSCSLVQASEMCSADCVRVSTSNNDNLCLPMAFGSALYFPENSDPPSDSGDANLSTPVHSPRDSFENPAIFATGSPLSDIVGSTCVNDSLQTSVVECTELQRNVEMNIASDIEVDACTVQEKGDLQIYTDYTCMTLETESKSDVMTAKCTSPHESSDCHESTSADTAQFETKLMDDSSYCTKSFDIVSDFPASTCSALSLRPEDNNKSSVLKPESCDITDQKEEETDADDDSASTLVYSCDCTASYFLDHITDTNRYSPDKNESETTVDYRQPSVSSANATWRVISFVDCRMRLVRTEAVFPTLSAQNRNKGNNQSSVLGTESHDATESVEETNADSDSMSVLVYSCDCPASSVLDHGNDGVKMKNETVQDYREASVSNTSSTWEVISFVDCRMKLVRSKVVFPTASTHTVLPDSRPWNANNSCNTKFVL